MSVLLPLAVDPSLLALAVVAGAVGALDDAGGAAGALLLAEGGRLRKGKLPEKMIKFLFNAQLSFRVRLVKGIVCGTVI